MAHSAFPGIRGGSAARGALALAGALACACGVPAAAQDDYAQPVIQPIPPAALSELNAAMRDLARDPRNVPALLRAGWASIDIEDTQAAIGYFRRAEAVSPGSGEVKAGLAAASLRLDDPVTAVRLFAEAEATGVPMARYGAERGLAHDLVGDNLAAQRYYRQALAEKDDPEVVRRLALSQAISGDQRASETTLLPLLQHRDLAAYRTRAFALAILGKGEEAVSIAETMLPDQLSNRMAPYLRYMPRLTRAQQAAAANLGQFPRASEIGRDGPQVAAFAAAGTPQVAARGPDARLVPAGEPLGSSGGASRNQRRNAGRDGDEERMAAGRLASVTTEPLPPVQQTAAAPRPAQAQAPQPAPPASDAAAQPARESGLDGTSLAEAFAAFVLPPDAAARPAAGAVDITAIKPAREAPRVEQPQPKPKPKPPAHPKRFWVQVATGRDVKALAFDWRRVKREAGDLLARRDAYTADWGQTNRLLAGPYASAAEAQKAVSALKEKGVDSFTFTSAEGEVVAPLK